MTSDQPDCIYCGEAIDALAAGDDAPSPEHVIGWSLGGALTIPTHRGCNGRANRLVDSRLAGLPDLGRIRGRLGIRMRSGPYIHRAVWDSPRGLRAFIFWTSDGLGTKLIPVGIPRGDRDTEVFIEPEDSEAYEEKHRERVEREGCHLGEPREPTGPSLVGKEVAILFREPGWMLPRYLWPAAVAKFGLGVIDDGCRHQFFPESTLDLSLIDGLRMMAFEKSIATELWDTERFRFLPTRLDATSCLARLSRHEHLLAVRAGTSGGSAVLHVVIFGRIAHELDLVGLQVAEDRVWLFDSLRRKVTRLGWEEMEARLNRRMPDGVNQLEFDPFLKAA